MSWVLDINEDVIPIIAPNSPTKFKKLIPKRLAKRLGEFDPERWTQVLSKHRTTLIINEFEYDEPVVAEYDPNRDDILLQITDTKHPELVFKTVQALMHEMIHVDQEYRLNPLPVRKFYSDDEFTMYLSSYDELEAFSHCLFLETMNGITYEECPVYKMYINTLPETRQILQKNFRRWSRTYKTLNHLLDK